MRVLVACEFSGAVRSAFRRLGHDAWSCDLLPSEDSGPHIQCDVRDVLMSGWDMMIAHPPCTHLASSGARHFHRKKREQRQALEFVQELLDAPIQFIALENPVGVISTAIRKPDQIIQPYQFGHPESKKTCLWLQNLPLLEASEVLPERPRWENQTPSGQNRLPPSADRWKKRSITYEGIAAAMASQWGAHAAGLLAKNPSNN